LRYTTGPRSRSRRATAGTGCGCDGPDPEANCPPTQPTIQTRARHTRRTRRREEGSKGTSATHTGKAGTVSVVLPWPRSPGSGSDALPRNSVCLRARRRSPCRNSECEPAETPPAQSTPAGGFALPPVNDRRGEGAERGQARWRSNPRSRASRTTPWPPPGGARPGAREGNPAHSARAEKRRRSPRIPDNPRNYWAGSPCRTSR